MPFALAFIGLIMIVTGAKGTHAALGKQLVSDFTGPGNFFYWIAAVGAVGAVGAIPGFKPFSRMFMTLIIIAMVIKNGGVFDKLLSAIKNGPVAPARGGEKSGNQASSMVSQGAANLQSSSAQAVQGVTDFRNATTQAPSNPLANFGKVMGLVGKFF